MHNNGRTRTLFFDPQIMIHGWKGLQRVGGTLNNCFIYPNDDPGHSDADKSAACPQEEHDRGGAKQNPASRTRVNSGKVLLEHLHDVTHGSYANDVQHDSPQWIELPRIDDIPRHSGVVKISSDGQIQTKPAAPRDRAGYKKTQSCSFPFQRGKALFITESESKPDKWGRIISRAVSNNQEEYMALSAASKNASLHQSFAVDARVKDSNPRLEWKRATALFYLQKLAITYLTAVWYLSLEWSLEGYSKKGYSNPLHALFICLAYPRKNIGFQLDFLIGQIMAHQWQCGSDHRRPTPSSTRNKRTRTYRAEWAFG
ncbi:hypothetical protein B0H11DRAFT_1922807 [Mycena galericulata]|nr:hypothetical protein B0H11DRAFT_1922807 [Mycena galericulata]